MTKRFKGLFFLWFTVLLWGVSFVATKLVVEYIPPITTGLIRFLIASIVLIILIRKKTVYSKMEFFYLSLAAFFGITAYFIFENSALTYTTATNGSLIISTTPIAFLIFDDILKKKFSSKLSYIGSFVAFIGVSILILNGRFVLELNPLGDILMFGSVISWILYTVYLQKLHHHHNLDVTKKLTILGALFFIPFSFFEIIRNPDLINLSIFVNPTSIIGLLYLSIFCSALGYIFWNNAIRLVGTKTTMNSIYFLPVVTVISETIILRNIPNIYVLLGATLVLTGTYTAEIKKNKN